MDQTPNGFINPKNSHKFFKYLKRLPNDIKRYIMMVLLGNSGFHCFEYSQPLDASASLSVFHPNGKYILISSLSTPLHTSETQMVNFISGEILFKIKTSLIWSVSLMNEKLISAVTREGLCVYDSETGSPGKEYIFINHKKSGPLTTTSEAASFFDLNPTANFDMELFVFNHPNVDKFDINERSYTNNCVTLNYYKEDKSEINQKEIHICYEKLRMLIESKNCGNLRIIGVEKFCKILDTNTGKLVNSISEKFQFYSISSNNRRIAMSQAEAKLISIYDENFQKLNQFQFYLFVSSPTKMNFFKSLEISNDSIVIVAGYCDQDYVDSNMSFDKKHNFFQVYDGLLGQELYIKRGYLNPKFIMNGDIILAASDDLDKITFWHSRTGNFIKSIKFNSRFRSISNCFVVSPYDDIICLNFGIDNSILLSNKRINDNFSFYRYSSKDNAWELYRKLYYFFYLERDESMIGKTILPNLFNNKDSNFTINFDGCDIQDQVIDIEDINTTVFKRENELPNQEETTGSSCIIC